MCGYVMSLKGNKSGAVAARMQRVHLNPLKFSNECITPFPLKNCQESIPCPPEKEHFYAKIGLNLFSLWGWGITFLPWKKIMHLSCHTLGAAPVENILVAGQWVFSLLLGEHQSRKTRTWKYWRSKKSQLCETKVAD